MLARRPSQGMDFPNNQYHAYKYFNPRWRKTQVTFYVSCVNSNITGQQTNDEGAATPKTQQIAPNGSRNSNHLSKRLEIPSKSERRGRSSSFEETDDVFFNAQRRASEPLKQDAGVQLARFGTRKSHKLRSFSEGGTKEKSGGHRKLTKSKSSTEFRTGNPTPLHFNFSPQFVRKISLRSSLQDWLESQKQLKNFRKIKRGSIGDSNGGVSMEERKKELRNEDSRSLRPRAVAWGTDCQQTTSAKHVYRRFSAESLEIGCQPQMLTSVRRPSAPPCLSEEQNGDKSICYRKKAVDFRRVTTSLNIQQARSVACRNTDVKYDNTLDFHIHCVMKDELRSRLNGLCFCPETCRRWCEEISEAIKARVQLLSTSPCKVVCTVYIGALRDFGIHSATQALLDYKLDHHASAYYQNKSLCAVASVFAIRYNSK